MKKNTIFIFSHIFRLCSSGEAIYIYTVVDEESESEVIKCKKMHPGGKT